MYIIIVGGGQVGYHLAKELIAEGHEVLLIEKDARTCERINEDLGSVCVRGDGCEAATLEDVGAGRADVFIAVTGEDEDNLVSCQVAKVRFGVRRTIARINNPKNDRIFRLLGIDAPVSSTQVILEHIEHEVPQHPLMHLMDLSRFGMEIVDIVIGDDSPVRGQRLGDVLLPAGAFISVVITSRGGPQAPNPSLVLMPGDELIAVTPIDQETRLRRMLAGV
ncbi:MAG: TrkA family potassium uptake protein [Chloroflexota bacterium]|nr:TrkA family potassium uptake protein [Dehalococcoidia bacterium]MDW8254442.1 TrkA family potassium uptake protein [Chloroflexota bacterium]